MRGVKSFIELFKEPFDRDAKALKKAKENLKEKGINPNSNAGKELIEDEILIVLAEWQKKTDDGEIAHKVIQEREMSRFPNSKFEGWTKGEGTSDVDAKIINHLQRDIHYFEKEIIDSQLNIRGFSDHVFVDKKGYIHIEDYKSTQNFTRGFTFEKNNIRFQIPMLYPIANITDCKYSLAALQCSVYMYLLWKYNPKLKPGTITIIHVDMNDDGSMKNIETKHEAPYLIEEVKAMIREYKKNV